MHLTLHLTTGCNLRCDYCYSPPSVRRDMDESVAFAAIEYAARSSANTGIIFFGGEPLLRKGLIFSTIDFSKKIARKTGNNFHYKVTTNGLLLDEQFLEFADKAALAVSLSIDGGKEANDRHRKDRFGRGIFEALENKASLLLKYQPYASALMVVSPQTVRHYARSVEFLLQKGFRYIVASLNYAGNWQDSDLAELKNQYLKLSGMYKEMTLKEKKFYFSPFEVKFATHIIGEDAACNRCVLGKRQVSVAPDGKIYPCVQFVKDGVSNQDYVIGNVRDGIDEKKRDSLYALSLQREEACGECAISGRCNHRCSCLNWQATGNINTVSRFLCASEKALIPIVDKLGDQLYHRRAPMFIQKHYNAVYPVMSYLEDTISV